MKIKDRIKYWRDIKNGTNIPIFFCNIDINKFRIKKENSCTVNFHPTLLENLTEKQKSLLEYHIGQAIDIIRENLEVEDLK